MESKIVSKNSSALVVLAEKHQTYVDALKKALIVGQLGFLKAGEMLHKIKEEQTYVSEDQSHRWSWEDFLSRPDLPIPGSTPESAKRIAQTLIKVYELFIVKYKCKENELAEIGWTKLNMIAAPIEKFDEKEREAGFAEYFEKAKNLTRKDLYADIKSGNAPIGTGLQCDHEFEILEWRCPDCGARSKEPMNKRHADTIIKYNTKK